ncbi:hypothetical protein ACFYXQ_03805 [Nocardia jiangxiensis]|uniref:Uncharacterized protein n=1 Tax=Nocardia jiangxiensis TaxID=282685 RepID=A0ABW6RU23_9NOCA
MATVERDKLAWLLKKNRQLKQANEILTLALPFACLRSRPRTSVIVGFVADYHRVCQSGDAAKRLPPLRPSFTEGREGS